MTNTPDHTLSDTEVVANNTIMKKWTNRDNLNDYYNKSPIINILKSYAKLGGLESGCDVNELFPYIKHCKSLLEIGGGYGRAIKQLYRLNFRGDISVVERSPLFSKELKLKYPSIFLYESDIISFSPTNKFDAIIYLWSGISDFPSHEQASVVKKLANLLTQKGTLIIDTSISGQPPLNASTSCDQEYIITKGPCTARGYIPSFTEIKNYASDANLTLNKATSYQTDTNRNRMLYIFNN